MQEPTKEQQKELFDAVIGKDDLFEKKLNSYTTKQLSGLKNRQGFTLATWAAVNHKASSLEKLWKLGADLTLPDSEGRTVSEMSQSSDLEKNLQEVGILDDECQVLKSPAGEMRALAESVAGGVVDIAAKDTWGRSPVGMVAESDLATPLKERLNKSEAQGEGTQKELDSTEKLLKVHERQRNAQDFQKAPEEKEKKDIRECIAKEDFLGVALALREMQTLPSVEAVLLLDEAMQTLNTEGSLVMQQAKIIRAIVDKAGKLPDQDLQRLVGKAEKAGRGDIGTALLSKGAHFVTEGADYDVPEEGARRGDWKIVPFETYKEVLIVGPRLSVSSELKDLCNGKESIIIGNGQRAITLKEITEKLKSRVDENTRFYLHLHGGPEGSKYSAEFSSDDFPKGEVIFKTLSDCMPEGDRIIAHVYSCFAGLAVNDVTSAAKGSVIFGHGVDYGTEISGVNEIMLARQLSGARQSKTTFLEERKKLEQSIRTAQELNRSDQTLELLQGRLDKHNETFPTVFDEMMQGMGTVLGQDLGCGMHISKPGRMWGDTSQLARFNLGFPEEAMGGDDDIRRFIETVTKGAHAAFKNLPESFVAPHPELAVRDQAESYVPQISESELLGLKRLCFEMHFYREKEREQWTKAFIEDGVTLDFKFTNGLGPIEMAVFFTDKRMTSTLIEYYEKYNERFTGEFQYEEMLAVGLDAASKITDYIQAKDFLDLFITAGANPALKVNGQIPLKLMLSNVKVMEYLMQHKDLKVNCQDDTNGVILQAALDASPKEQSRPLVDWVLARGASPLGACYVGNSVFTQAVIRGDLKLAEQVLPKGNLLLVPPQYAEEVVVALKLLVQNKEWGFLETVLGKVDKLEGQAAADLCKVVMGTKDRVLIEKVLGKVEKLEGKAAAYFLYDLCEIKDTKVLSLALTKVDSFEAKVAEEFTCYHALSTIFSYAAQAKDLELMDAVLDKVGKLEGQGAVTLCRVVIKEAPEFASTVLGKVGKLEGKMAETLLYDLCEIKDTKVLSLALTKVDSFEDEVAKEFACGFALKTMCDFAIEQNNAKFLTQALAVMPDSWVMTDIFKDMFSRADKRKNPAIMKVLNDKKGVVLDDHQTVEVERPALAAPTTVTAAPLAANDETPKPLSAEPISQETILDTLRNMAEVSGISVDLSDTAALITACNSFIRSQSKNPVASWVGREGVGKSGEKELGI